MAIGDRKYSAQVLKRLRRVHVAQATFLLDTIAAISEPSWHRRERKQRAQSRKRLLFFRDYSRLLRHHGSAPPKMMGFAGYDYYNAMGKGRGDTAIGPGFGDPWHEKGKSKGKGKGKGIAFPGPQSPAISYNYWDYGGGAGGYRDYEYGKGKSGGKSKGWQVKGGSKKTKPPITWYCDTCGMAHQENHTECYRCIKDKSSSARRRRWNKRPAEVSNRYDSLSRDEDDMDGLDSGEDDIVGDNDNGMAKLPPKPKQINAVLNWLMAKGADRHVVSDIENMVKQENDNITKAKDKDPWKLLQSSKDKMRSITMQMDEANLALQEVQAKQDEMVAWKEELLEKQRLVSEDIDKAQKCIAENDFTASATDAADETARLREQMKLYEGNLKDIMGLVMSGIPEDKTGKRQLYDMIFRFPLQENANASPFSHDKGKTQEFDIVGGADASGAFRATEDELKTSPFSTASQEKASSGKGSSRAAPYSA